MVNRRSDTDLGPGFGCFSCGAPDGSFQRASSSDTAPFASSPSSWGPAGVELSGWTRRWSARSSLRASGSLASRTLATPAIATQCCRRSTTACRSAKSAWSTRRRRRRTATTTCSAASVSCFGASRRSGSAAASMLQRSLWPSCAT